MKILLIISILFTAILSAKDRPKIALVLSGGGARGGAHVGVLRVLEEKKIPIDLIVGTSMGAFVGGLYAAGKTPDEIGLMLTSTVWKDYIRSEFHREDTPIRVKQYDNIYNGRMILGLNSNNDISLPTGMLNRQPFLFKILSQTQNVEHITNYDNLPIPFRAIATDIENGNAVVMSSGSLSKSIYASSAIPGGLQPIVIDGKTLIDGGVSDNIPILEAKKMGADIIIAVDVSEHFDKDLNVNSYFEVLGQLVNILMRKNADFSISQLDEDDVLITPDLNAYGGLDAHKYKEIIQRGDDATREIYESEFRKLSLSDEEYLNYKDEHRNKPKRVEKVIDKIVIQNDTHISDESIMGRLHFKTGDIIDEDIIRRDLIHLYNMTIFDSVDYSIETNNDENIVTVITKPSWNANGDIRFALNLEDDFEGHSSYGIKIGYTMHGLNEFGGEWKNDFEIGKRQKIYTELFQPLGSMQMFYIKSALSYNKWIDLMPENGGNQEVKLYTLGADLALGTQLGTDFQLEVGISTDKEKNEANIVYDGTIKSAIYRSKAAFVSVLVDNLDNYNFPSSGIKAKAMYIKEFSDLGSDFKFQQFYTEVEKPFSYKNNSLVGFFKLGITKDTDATQLSVRDGFFLGGMFNLSGYKSYTFRENNMMFGALKYRYRLKDGGFLGSVGIPFYVGATLESGGTWSDRTEVYLNDLKASGSLYVAADTFLGPFYLAYGVSEADNQTLYLYLGEKF